MTTPNTPSERQDVSIETVAWLCTSSNKTRRIEAVVYPSARDGHAMLGRTIEPLVRRSDHEAALAEANELLSRWRNTGIGYGFDLLKDTGAYLAKQGAKP